MTSRFACESFNHGSRHTIDVSAWRVDGGTAVGDGKEFQKFCPDWKKGVLWDQWIKFGVECFSKGLPMIYRIDDILIMYPEIDPPMAVQSKTINTPIPIGTHADGGPELPTITMCSQPMFSHGLCDSYSQPTIRILHHSYSSQRRPTLRFLLISYVGQRSAGPMISGA